MGWKGASPAKRPSSAPRRVNDDQLQLRLLACQCNAAAMRCNRQVWDTLLPTRPSPPKRPDPSHRPAPVRKGYHVLAVALFLPVLPWEPGLLALALAVAFAGLVAVEAVRAAALPGVSRRITGFMERFTDARDAGPVYVTHFALLLGMALPIWLGLDWEGPEVQSDSWRMEGGAGPGTVRVRPPALAGILILGARGGAVEEPTGATPRSGPCPDCMRRGIRDQTRSQSLRRFLNRPGFGDSAASLVGRLWGRHALAADSPKTWEGLAAGAAATLAGWVGAWLLTSVLPGAALRVGPGALGGLLAATLASCFLEAVTGQLDNAVLPLHYYTLLLCLT